ncbi:MAG: SCP2 sterol-binding domain-containing protein [Promethearchaeota archaeon]
MVDEALANDVRKIRDEGMSDPKDILKIFELMKQASAEIDDLKEELEDIDEFIGQMVIDDKGFKWWAKIGDGAFDYGEGESSEDPSFTMTANWETMSGLMIGEIDGTSAYMSGDLKIEGNLQDTMAYGEYLQFAAETLEELDEQ